MSREHDDVALRLSRVRPAERPPRDAPMLSSLPVEAIRRHIRMNVTDRIRVSDIAKIAGLDALRFARVLRRQCRITPYALVIATRVEFAEQLLRGGMSVAEAAISAGFCDQSHLTRHFRRRLGITPSSVHAARKREDCRESIGSRTAAHRRSCR